MRLLLFGLLVMSTTLGAEEHRFNLNEIKLYEYTMTQEVVWQSAGDVLNFTTQLTWQFSLATTKITTDSAEVEVEILSLKGQHQGPGSHHEVYIHPGLGISEGADDPLLGNWAALVDATLTLTIDPKTGHISAVRGQEAIIDNLTAANPGPPGEPSPIAAAAEAAYASERLAALWNRLFETAATGDGPMDLEAPFNGQVQRQWTGDRYNLSLIDGAAPVLELAGKPTPITVQVEALTGEGAIEVAGGILRRSEGTVRMELAGTALTQGVRQTHTITWALVWQDLSTLFVAPTPPPEAEQPEAEAETPELETDPGALKIQVSP